jgi:hypothetical protein
MSKDKELKDKHLRDYQKKSRDTMIRRMQEKNAARRDAPADDVPILKPEPDEGPKGIVAITRAEQEAKKKS